MSVLDAAAPKLSSIPTSSVDNVPVSRRILRVIAAQDSLRNVGGERGSVAVPSAVSPEHSEVRTHRIVAVLGGLRDIMGEQGSAPALSTSASEPTSSQEERGGLPAGDTNKP
jgi:hypothetical protein